MLAITGAKALPGHSAWSEVPRLQPTATFAITSPVDRSISCFLCCLFRCLCLTVTSEEVSVETVTHCDLSALLRRVQIHLLKNRNHWLTSSSETVAVAVFFVLSETVFLHIV